MCEGQKYNIGLILYSNKNLATAVLFACHVLGELNNCEGGRSIDQYSMAGKHSPGPHLKSLSARQ